MKSNRGFTLVELLAVIVLIAVLAVVAIATYRGVTESSKNKALEAKITQITSAAEKWARENNITSRTTISVNNLVVEGYITADDVDPSGLAMMKNPVTEENMICNTIDLFFTNGEVKAKYNSNVQNCKLANQSVVDSKIIISAYSKDRNGNSINVSGTGSIAKWTNQDLVIVVDSTDYDSKATSISYDFEGNTFTKSKGTLEKYTGTTFITAEETKKYYNVFYIESELILNSKIVVTYEIPGEGTKSRAYTIRFDKEEATASLKVNSEWVTSDTPITILVDDGKGSGPARFYLTTTETFSPEKYYDTDYKGTTLNDTIAVGKYFVWTEDKAGNISSTYKTVLDVNNTDDFEPDCEVLFHGNKGQGHWYKEVPVTPGGRNITPAGVSGVNLGASASQSDHQYSAFAAYNTINEGLGLPRTTNTTRAGSTYYCHAKTLAGKYGTGSATLWLDMTPPVITLEVTSDEEYTRRKTVWVNVTDNLSGLDAETRIKYGWALEGQQPTSWSEAFAFIGNPGEKFSVDLMVNGNGLTGIYYLWIDASSVQDYAGNMARNVNSQGTVAVFGPYMFDNTPPVCDVNNGKTNWTNGGYTINQYCRDDEGTPDQSQCSQEVFYKVYTNADNVRTDSLIIRDNVGLETECPFNVFLENTKPSCQLHEPAGGPNGDHGWYKSASVTISATFQDNGDTSIQSGVGTKGTAKTPNSTNGASSVTFTENGSALTAYCYVQDIAGNFNSNSLTIKKDDGTEARNGGCSIIGENFNWTNATWTYWTVLNVLPVSGSCVESEHDYGSVFTEDCKSYVDIVQGTTLSCAEHQTVYFMTYSGEEVVCDFINRPCLYCDTVPPKCDGSTGESTTWTKNNRTITVGCEDGEKDAENIRKHKSLCTQSTFSKTFNTTTEVGQVPIYDNAGNATQCPVNVYVDKTGPVCGTVTGASTTWTTGNRTISVACSDGHSGCENDSYSSTFTTTGRTGTITIKDNVGNTTSCTVNKYIDKSNPTCSVSKSNTGKTTGVTCTVGCSDTGSGCVTSGDDQGAHTGKKSSTTYTVKDKVGHTDSCTCSITSYNCNCDTCYGNWGEWYCTNNGSVNLRTPTKECNDGFADCAAVGSGYSFICRTRSSYSCNCDTCYK